MAFVANALTKAKDLAFKVMTKNILTGRPRVQDHSLGDSSSGYELTHAVCLLCGGQFSFYAQPAPSTTSASNIVDFIDRSIAQSRAGQSLYFLRAQKPGSAAGSASSVPVQLLYPVSRPGHLVDHAPSAVTSPLSSSSSSSSAAAVGRTPHHSAASRRRTADLLG